MSIQAVPTRAPARRALVRSGAIAIGLAVLAELAVWAIAAALVSDLQVPTGPGGPLADLTPMQVIPATIVGSLAGIGLALIAAGRRDPVRLFTMLALTGLVLSFAPVLTVPVSAGSRITLGVMHLVAAAVLIPLLRAGLRGGALRRA